QFPDANYPEAHYPGAPPDGQHQGGQTPDAQPDAAPYEGPLYPEEQLASQYSDGGWQLDEPELEQLGRVQEVHHPVRPLTATPGQFPAIDVTRYPVPPEQAVGEPDPAAGQMPATGQRPAAAPPSAGSATGQQPAYSTGQFPAYSTGQFPAYDARQRTV